MSAAHTGTPNAVFVLMELDPFTVVYDKMQSLVSRHPETKSLMDELVHSVGQTVDSLDQDFNVIERFR